MPLDWCSIYYLPRMGDRIAEASDEYETYYAEIPDTMTEAEVMDDFVQTYQFADEGEPGFDRSAAEEHLRANVASVHLLTPDERAELE